jgi:hypothetical protein
VDQEWDEGVVRRWIKGWVWIAMVKRHIWMLITIRIEALYDSFNISL